MDRTSLVCPLHVIVCLLTYYGQKLDESMAQRSPSVDPWSEGLQTSFQAHQPVPTVDGQDNRIKSVRNTYVVLHQESQNPTTDAPIQSHAETQSNNGTINGTMKLPTDNAGSSHLSSPSTTSFSPGRYFTSNAENEVPLLISFLKAVLVKYLNKCR